MKKFIYNYFLIGSFICFIFLFGIANYLSPIKDTSFIENRSLSKKPNFSVKNIKEFISSYEKFYSDQFIFREDMLKLYTELQIKLKKSNIQNVYINGDWLLGKMDILSKESIDTKVTNTLNIKKASSDKKFYYFSIPHKSSALIHLYPSFDSTVKNHDSNKDYFINELNDNGINAYNIDNLIKKKYSITELENMYYKTDHHWNAYGAYAASKEIFNIIGIDLDESLYKILEVDKKNFTGSYNRKLASLFNKKETMSSIVTPNTEDIVLYGYVNKVFMKLKTQNYLSPHYNLEDITYGGFYHGDYPYLKIINQNSLLDEKILIVRDSYQAPTTPLFASIFREVEIVDDRHLNLIDKQLTDIIKDSDADYVIYFKYL